MNVADLIYSMFDKQSRRWAIITGQEIVVNPLDEVARLWQEIEAIHAQLERRAT